MTYCLSGTGPYIIAIAPVDKCLTFCESSEQYVNMRSISGVLKMTLAHLVSLITTDIVACLSICFKGYFNLFHIVQMLGESVFLFPEINPLTSQQIDYFSTYVLIHINLERKDG